MKASVVLIVRALSSKVMFADIPRSVVRRQCLEIAQIE